MIKRFLYELRKRKKKQIPVMTNAVRYGTQYFYTILLQLVVSVVLFCYVT